MSDICSLHAYGTDALVGLSALAQGGWGHFSFFVFFFTFKNVFNCFFFIINTAAIKKKKNDIAFINVNL